MSWNPKVNSLYIIVWTMMSVVELPNKDIYALYNVKKKPGRNVNNEERKH